MVYGSHFFAYSPYFTVINLQHFDETEHYKYSDPGEMRNIRERPKNRVSKCIYTGTPSAKNVKTKDIRMDPTVPDLPLLFLI